MTTLAVPITPGYQPHCRVCDDSGMQEYACGAEAVKRQPWLMEQSCERKGSHGPHAWVQYCFCVAMNPVVQGRRAKDIRCRPEAVRRR